jgi:hypothetical protein
MSHMPAAVVHVDLDGASEIFAAHQAPYPYDGDPIFESGLTNLFEFLAANGLTATLFVIASSLDQPAKRRLLEEAVRRGHEVASHTVTHAYLRDLPPARKRAELADSRARLEDALGIRVRGFRAPGYKIDRASVDLLAECGYEYDSSAFPTAAFAAHLKVGVRDLESPRRPFAGNPIVEVPLPDHRPFPVPFTPSYALVIGRPYFHWGLSRAAGAGCPFVLLFHLIDLADPLPSGGLGWKLRLFTLSSLSAAEKRRRCQQMLDATRRRYRLITTAALLEEVDGGPATSSERSHAEI